MTQGQLTTSVIENVSFKKFDPTTSNSFQQLLAPPEKENTQTLKQIYNTVSSHQKLVPRAQENTFVVAKILKF